jgi:hypothetical protein
MEAIVALGQILSLTVLAYGAWLCGLNLEPLPQSCQTGLIDELALPHRPRNHRLWGRGRPDYEW